METSLEEITRVRALFPFSLIALAFCFFNLSPLHAQEAQVDSVSRPRRDSMSMIHDKPLYLMTSDDCGAMEVWDIGMGMPMPYPMARMPMSMMMVHGNGFLTLIAEEGLLKGRSEIAAPNMFMADLGTTSGGGHYFNLDVMLTAELWTIPKNGYPELYQIGENQADGTPFIDAQHPHSSPLMGLTLSDTIALADGDKSHLKLFIAPRGESTDGPIAFMHRATGMFNPDAPLGHHIGQDVGHVSSSVIGESLKLGGFHLEASLFHGLEPNPTQVDLPLGSPDSCGFRLIQEFSPDFTLMASYAFVNNPEPGIPNAERYSASLYSRASFGDEWAFRNTLIYGLVTHIDNASLLSSVLEEFLIGDSKTHFFGRVEVLQRTPNQLGITGLPDPDKGRWMTAISLGYSHQLASWDGWELNCGAMATNDQSPPEFADAYAGNPLTYKFFFQLGGMGMSNL